MKLPNGERAKVDFRKLRDYCLNVDSPRGRHKARVFASVLGITAANARQLQARLVEAARSGDARRGDTDVYGERYTIDFEMVTPVGRAIIRSGWIVLRTETAPRFTTCYVVKGAR